MMISQPALMCLEATWRRLTERRVRDLEPERIPQPGLTRESLELPREVTSEASVAAPDGGARPITASVVGPPPKALPESNGDSPLTADERRARAAALRGLALSRGRRFDRAQLAFTEAARLDPMLDLTRIPGFWKLERSAHEAAIVAYQDVGRERDAAVLRAHVRSTYRPKPLRPRAGAALSS